MAGHRGKAYIRKKEAELKMEEQEVKKENEESLSEKIWREKADNPFVLTKDIKEKIQEFLSELKGKMKNAFEYTDYRFIEININKLALKKFGKGILE